MITAPTLEQLAEIRHDLVGAANTDDVVRATLQLVTWLEADRQAAADTDRLLRQLVREAFEMFTNAESPLDLRDWLRAAEPFIRD